MEKEATQQGVSRQQEQRDALLIKRSKERSEEQAHPEEEPMEELGTSAIEKVEDKPETMILFTGGDGKLYEVPEGATAALKIDGEEVQTPIDTALRRYQKGAAGDKRLQEASSKQRDIQAQQQDLDRREQQFLNQAKQAKTEKDRGNLSNDDYAKRIKDLSEALVEADEERTAELLREVLPRQTVAKTDPLEVENTVSRKLKEYRKQDDLKKAQADFYKDYSDLAEDPMLFGMVDNKTAQIVTENPGMPPSEIITKAAKEVKAWQDAQFKATAPKKKKKQSLTPISGRAKIGEDEPPPQTRKDVIKTMREARGQPV